MSRRVDERFQQASRDAGPAPPLERGAPRGLGELGTIGGREREHLRERLRFYDMQREFALYAHHPLPDIRKAAQDRIARLLSGHNHLDGLVW